MSAPTRSLRWWIGFGAAVAGLLLGEIGLLVNRVAASRAGEKRLVQQRRILADLASSAPAPSADSARAIGEDLARAQQRVASLAAVLTGNGAAANRLRSARTPATRTEAFFDLAGFVERGRQRMTEAGEICAPVAANFGFSHHAQEGPEPGLIGPVFRQRVMAEHLLDALLEARPRSLEAMQRTRPWRDAERQARAKARAQPGSAGVPPAFSDRLGARSSSDTFTPDVRFGIDAVLPTLETAAFRLVFTGDTQTLRTFVLRLASFDSAVWVRAIDVQLLPEEKKVDQAARVPTRPVAASVVLSAQPTSVLEAPRRLVVAKSVSQFTVVVEFIEYPTVMSAESGVAPKL